MGTINDGEFLPGPEALVSFLHEADTNVRPLSRAFWERLDLSEDMAAGLVSKRQQEKAVTRFVKNYLEQQLLKLSFPSSI